MQGYRRLRRAEAPRWTGSWFAVVALAAALAATAAARGARDGTCSWRLSSGPPWSDKTGQHTVTFAVRDRSSAACALRGYPRIAFLDARGTVLPFTYAHRGDQMITSARPRRVVVHPGRSAFFAANKYRCDTRTRAVARVVRVVLPGSGRRLAVRLGGGAVIDFCSRGAPSGIVTVSPIVARPAAAAAP